MRLYRTVKHPHVSLDREIARLPGGRRILAARDAAARLVERLPGIRAAPGGALDGWSGIARRGRIEHLLPGEHVQEEDEFLRRHFDGEQLYLARGSSWSGAASAFLAWDFTVAGLGSPRLTGLGAALALKRRLEEDGSSFRLGVNGGNPIELSTGEEVQAILELPPAVEPVRGAVREATLEGWKRGTAEVYWMASEPDLPDPEAIVRSLSGEPALLLAGTETIGLLVKGRGRGAGWEEVARIHIPGGGPR
jgi:hypothetical protein